MFSVGINIWNSQGCEIVWAHNFDKEVEFQGLPFGPSLLQ